ncbi:uncharacterized protein [Palaemon carinicauda]|uniref:uncharacterized protein n=1 Tax=Palaemon carinicauda TaxID=392227 RepID=UPI0035B63687
MSQIRRPPQATPRRASPAMPRALSQAVMQAQTLIADQQRAIHSFQDALPGSGARASKVPVSAAPEKCDAVMSLAAFRSWRRSMTGWIHLNKFPPQDVVLHLRLHCVPALQRALDARYSDARWNALAPDAALDAIGNIVLRSSNQAVQWSKFFALAQGREESVSDYFSRCAQKATDSDFQCPKCGGCLIEYTLLRKIMVGLSDPVLKRHVFQACDAFKSVDALQALFCTFEAAGQDVENVPRVAIGERESADASSDDVEPDVAVLRGNFNAKRSGNCGGVPCIWSSVVPSKRYDVPQVPKVSTLVVADTEAQICVGGPTILSSLQINPLELQPRTGLRDIANLRVRCLGSTACFIDIGGRCTKQVVYFVPTAKNFFISLNACKELGIVPPGFPHPYHLIASADVLNDEVARPNSSCLWRRIYQDLRNGYYGISHQQPLTQPGNLYL